MPAEISTALETDPPPRKRKEHHKSRWGCQNCKRRHIRCDERRPACTPCLVKHIECSFVLTESQFRRRDELPATGGEHDGSDLHEMHPSQRLAAALSGQHTLSAAPADPFGVLPTAMNYKSNEVFHHLIQIRSGVRKTIGQNPCAQYTERLATDAQNFSISLMAAAGHRGCLTNAFANYKNDMGLLKAFFYHKVRVIRLSQEAIDLVKKDPSYMYRCMDGIVNLHAMELREGYDQRLAHVRGLFALVDLEKRRRGSSRYMYGNGFARKMLVTATMIGTARILLDAGGRVDPKQLADPKKAAAIVASCPAVNALAGTRYVSWVMACYRFWHLYAEFVVDPEVLPLSSLELSEPLDACVFRWFLKVLYSPHAAAAGTGGKSTETPLRNSNNSKTSKGSAADSESSAPSHHRDPELRLLIVAFSALALITATTHPLPDESDAILDAERAEMRQTLLRIRRWCDGTIARWRDSQALMSWEMTSDVLRRIEWMTTLPGQKLIAWMLRDAVERGSSSLTGGLVEVVETGEERGDEPSDEHGGRSSSISSDTGSTGTGSAWDDW